MEAMEAGAEAIRGDDNRVAFFDEAAGTTPE
jgi:hypothetical protein